MSFETVKEIIDDHALKNFMAKWKGKPKEPYDKDKAMHWSKILLPGDREFWFEIVKMTDDARKKLFLDKPDAAERYHELWEKLRESGWRRVQDRDGIYHWYCCYEHTIGEPTNMTAPAITEAEQTRWESEYYDNDFVPEQP